MILSFMKWKNFSGEKTLFSDKITTSQQSLIINKVFGRLSWHCPRKSFKILNYIEKEYLPLKVSDVYIFGHSYVQNSNCSVSFASNEN